MILYNGDKKAFVVEHINRLVDEKSLTKAEMARRLDVKPQFLNSIVNTDKNVSDKFFQKFVNEFNLLSELDVNKNINQNKPIGLVDKPKEIDETNKAERFDYLIDNLFELIKIKDEKIQELSEEVGKLKNENKQLRNNNGCNIAEP